MNRGILRIINRYIRNELFFSHELKIDTAPIRAATMDTIYFSKGFSYRFSGKTYRNKNASIHFTEFCGWCVITDM